MFENRPEFFPLIISSDTKCLEIILTQKKIKTMASAASLEAPVSSTSEVQDVNKLMYMFDADEPWKYFSGVPLASSVERGRKQTTPKLKKIYIRKRKQTTARKNRPHREIETMSLQCSCDQGCLRRQGERASRLLIRQLRENFFQKSYNEQNYILARLMEIRVCPSGFRRINYKIPSLGIVCRGAFEKCYGISKRKIRVLLKKMDQADGVSVQQDMRGRHEKKMTKLLPEARQTVIAYICSYKACESHYRRSRTQKKYFESNVSMTKMWQDFCANNPHFKTNSSKRNNKGPVISFSTFRNIFHQNLRDTLSFRKARVDTCQYCDKTQNKINQISSEIKCGNLRRADKLQQLRNELEAHLRESEVRFASQKYDMLVLPKNQ